MSKLEKEVLITAKIPESLREKVYEYTQREGIKIKFVVKEALEKFFRSARLPK